MSVEKLTTGTVLPEFHVSALAPVEPHENKIHEDDLARQYGFKGGLVPGVTVYAWMTHPVVEALGAEWLERGEFQTRFAKPIYYEEPATIRAGVASRTGDSVTVGSGPRASLLPPPSHPHVALDAVLARVKELARAAGAVEVLRQATTYDAPAASHVGGTCRMGTDPRASVVTAYGRTHDVPNLFIVDASVLPGQGAGDSPSLTIQALALRAAVHIASLARRGEL